MIRPGAAELTLTAALLLAAAGRAGAQPGARDLGAELRAAELFDLGLDRKRAGDLDGACAAFAESQALDAALGTQLNLAACLERDGRIDEARALLRTTLDEANRRGDLRRAEHARAELARLEALAATGTPAATASDGRPRMSTDPRAAPNAATDPHAAPNAATDPGAAASASSDRLAATPRRSTRLPFALGLGAGALTAGGVALVLWGHDQQASADAACPVIGRPDCDAVTAQRLNDAAVMRSRIGVGMLVGGVVIAEAALYLWWRNRGRDAGPAVTIEPGGGAVTYGGTF